MKSFVKTIITVVLTASVTFALTSMFFASRHIDFTSGDADLQQLNLKLEAVNTYLENNYLYEDIDYQKAGDAAVKAYVESLEEPYTHYYTSEEFETYISRVEESYVGIGVVISADAEADKIVVVSPLKDSPAYKAGIKPGDYILAVDDKSYNANGMDECVNAIKSGKEGTKVKITIEREGKMADYYVERSEIVEESVQYEMLDNKIGYISISSFNTHSEESEESTYTEFVEAVETLKDKGMEKLIIDVRDNPGGVLSVVCDIADYILPEGIITYTKTRSGIRNDYESDAKELDIPMVVLINESSASASEILAGALKDHERAEIVGKTSYGKGIVQNVFPFSDGSGMSMTVSKYYTPDGISIHKVGVKPDVEVDLPKEYQKSYISDIPRSEDTQLDKAIEILKAQ